MQNNIGIFGTSGFAREVGDIAHELGFKPIYIARDENELDSCNHIENIILESEVLNHEKMVFAIGIGENETRERIATRYFSKLQFPNLIHPDASFGYRQKENLSINQGVIVCSGVRFTNNIQIGDFSIFNLNSTVGHDVVIGKFTNVAPGANISGNVKIGACCWVGTGAVINQGSLDNKLEIGDNTVIGSGSVVLKSCDPNAVYVGIPARRVK